MNVFSALCCKCLLIYGANSFLRIRKWNTFADYSTRMVHSKVWSMKECILNIHSVHLNWIVNSNFSEQHSICFSVFRFLAHSCHWPNNVLFYHVFRHFLCIYIYLSCIPCIHSYTSMMVMATHEVCQFHALVSIYASTFQSCAIHLMDNILP